VSPSIRISPSPSRYAICQGYANLSRKPREVASQRHLFEKRSPSEFSMHRHLDPEFATRNGSIGSTPSVSPGQPLPPHPAKPITTPTLTTRKHPPSLHQGTKPKAVQSCRSRRPTNLRERSEAVVSRCRPSVSPHNALGRCARTLVEGRRMRRLEAQGAYLALPRAGPRHVAERGIWVFACPTSTDASGTLTTVDGATQKSSRPEGDAANRFIRRTLEPRRPRREPGLAASRSAKRSNLA
jgi:hypothetical protein